MRLNRRWPSGPEQWASCQHLLPTRRLRTPYMPARPAWSLDTMICALLLFHGKGPESRWRLLEWQMHTGNSCSQHDHYVCVQRVRCRCSRPENTIFSVSAGQGRTMPTHASRASGGLTCARQHVRWGPLRSESPLCQALRWMEMGRIMGRLRRFTVPALFL
jgi:hypothetical protein